MSGVIPKIPVPIVVQVMPRGLGGPEDLRREPASIRRLWVPLKQRALDYDVRHTASVFAGDFPAPGKVDLALLARREAASGG